MVYLKKVAVFLLTAMATLVSLLVAVPAVASAEISPNPTPTWGVTGLGPTQFTGPIDNQVWSIEQIGDVVYVGGRFTQVQQFSNSTPVAQPYLAAFDVDSGAHIASFAPAIDAPVYALKASPDGSRLYVGGEFTAVNGAAYTEGLAAIDPVTGAVDPTFLPDLNNPWSSYPVVVKSIDLDDTYLYAGGTFSATGGRNGVPRTVLSRLARASTATGLVDTTWTPTVSGGSIWGMALDDDSAELHIGGYFTTVNGMAQSQYFTSLDTTSGLEMAGITPWIDQTAYPNRGYIQDVEVFGDKIWIGGSEHAVWQLDGDTNEILRIHSTRRGGDYQDIEVVGDRIYASCHCYTDHYADYDYWVNRFDPVPGDVLVTPIKYVAAYDGDSGDYLSSFQLNAAATQSGVWAIHGDTNGCLWLGGDISAVGDFDAGTELWAGGFSRFCESAGGALPAPASVQSTFQDNSRIVINWSAVPGAVDYEIVRDGVAIGTDADRWFTDLDLPQGTTYDYQVRGITATGELGDLSDPLTVSTTGTPVGQPLPAPASVTSNFQDNSRIVLNWSAVTGAADYEILRDGVVIANDADRWFTDLGLPQGTSFTYEVRALAADGTPGELSDPLTVSTTGTPVGEPLPAPASVTSNFQDRSRIVLNWTAVTGAADYEILRDGVVIANDADRWFTDLNLPAGTTFTYEIRALAADGTPGELSDPLTVSTTGTPVGEPLPAPASVTSNFQDRSRIVLNWTAVTGAADYEILRDGVVIANDADRWFTDLNLPAGTTFTYEIRALAADGTPGELSDPITLSTLP